MNKFLSLLAALLMASIAGATAVTPHSVVANANDQQYWIARVERFNNEDYTAIYFRLLGQDDRWQRLCVIRGLAIDELAVQRQLAAALLRDKSWALLYADGAVSAGSLPASDQMLALAGGEKSWWAIGHVPGGLTSATATASTRQSPTTRRASTSHPSTQLSTSAPASPPTDSKAAMVLFELRANTWTPIAQLPDSPAEPAPVTLALIEEIPYVAILDNDSIAVHHLENGRWIKDRVLPGLKQVAAFKILGESIPPRLWVQQQSGPDLLFPLSPANLPPASLAPPSAIPAKDRDVVIFGRSLRMIGRTSDKMIEQRFAIDTLHPEDKPADLSIPDSTQLFDLQGLHTLIAIVTLMLVLLGWFRQQAAAQGIEPTLKNATIAPIGRRLAAGLVDASPVILVMFFFLVRHSRLPYSVPQSRQFLFFLAYWAAGLFYVLHTTLIETLAGRSLGKIMFGLRVVTQDGSTPTPLALFTRNALRLFDLSLFFFPVLFIPFSPLHQRSGDLAAATVVVTDEPTSKDPPADNNVSAL